MGNKNITQLLGAIDPNDLDKEVLTKLEAIMDCPEFSFVQVDRCCVAAKGLFEWIRAVRNYYFVYRFNESFRDKMIISDL